MRKIRYRLVYNRRKKLNRMGTAPIQIEAYLEGKKAYYSTGLYVSPSQWNERRSLIVKHPHEEELNRFLQEQLLALEWKELRYWKEGKTISLNLLHDEIEQELVQKTLIAETGRKWIEHSSRKESSKRNLYTTIDWVEIYRPGTAFQEITYKWLTGFEHFLHERQLSVNTVAKHLRQLRTLVNEAIRHGLLSLATYPFQGYHIKTADTHYSFLSPKEMNRLEHLILTNKNKRMQHVLDAFLFSCYTGLRYSDFVHQRKENIVHHKGHTWLIFKSVKTSSESKVPLDLLFEGKPMSILHKYKGREDSFFLLPSNSLTNKYVNKLGNLAQIKTHLSFHSARHTNATLLIYMGVQITTVQKLLGHRNVKTTQGYSDILDETIVKDLMKCKRGDE